jgi:predicted amidohydrolase YtcJ
LNTRTAFCHDPYPGMTGPLARGILNVPYDELVALMSKASAAGINSSIHAIGDDANTFALNAFEEVGCAGTIEHAQLVAWEDIERFAQLGVVASVQPEHAMDDRDVADVLWEGRTDRCFPFASMLDAGVKLAMGSDAPVAPLDPWFAIASAVERTRDGLPAWHPEQRIEPQAALDASVRTRIAIGERADLCVIDIDPLGASVDELRTMPVAATFNGGRATFMAL